MQGWFNIRKFTEVPLYHIARTKRGENMGHLNTEEVSDKIRQVFTVQTFRNQEEKGTFSWYRKAMTGKDRKFPPCELGHMVEIHHCYSVSYLKSQAEQLRERDKRHVNCKRSKIMSTHRWHDHTHRKSQRIYKKATRTNKQILHPVGCKNNTIFNCFQVRGCSSVVECTFNM